MFNLLTSPFLFLFIHTCFALNAKPIYWYIALLLNCSLILTYVINIFLGENLSHCRLGSVFSSSEPLNRTLIVLLEVKFSPLAVGLFGRGCSHQPCLVPWSIVNPEALFRLEAVVLVRWRVTCKAVHFRYELHSKPLQLVPLSGVILRVGKRSSVIGGWWICFVALQKKRTGWKITSLHRFNWGDILLSAGLLETNWYFLMKRCRGLQPCNNTFNYWADCLIFIWLLKDVLSLIPSIGYCLDTTSIKLCAYNWHTTPIKYVGDLDQKGRFRIYSNVAR